MNMDVWYEMMTYSPVFAAIGGLGAISWAIISVARLSSTFRRWIDE